jgi:uncharacterized protein YndB with AHSA1/START domain
MADDSGISGISEGDDVSIERSTDLDLDVEALWALLSTADGWSSWLVDHAEIAIEPDAIGTAVTDGVERSVRIESVVVGHGIGFTWWDRRDPSTASYVQLDLVELPHGRSHLDITERFIGTSASTVASTMSATMSAKWDVALVSLWVLALPLLVMA